MKKLLAALGGIGGYVIFIVVIAVFLVFGVRVAAFLEPIVRIIADVLFVIIVPIGLVMMIFKKSRAAAGTAYYALSWLLGFQIWLACVLYAFAVSAVWAVVGILMGGLGVFPVTAIMMLIRHDWSQLGWVVSALVVIFVLRLGGLFAISKGGTAEQPANRLDY